MLTSPILRITDPEGAEQRGEGGPLFRELNPRRDVGVDSDGPIGAALSLLSQYMPATLARMFSLAIGLVAWIAVSFMAPVSSLQPSVSSDTTIVPGGFDLQGHRGARGLAPENTLPAFQRALELGVTTLETDVVISGDGEVVVSHDPWMNPDICTTPDGKRIPVEKQQEYALYRMSYNEIATYDCGSLRLPQFPEQQTQPASKPRLREVLEWAERHAQQNGREPVFYNIETKSRPSWEGRFHPAPESFVKRLLAVVDEAGVAARTTIQSFDPRTLEVAHRQNDRVRTSLLVNRTRDRGMATNLESLSFIPDIYSPDDRLVDDALIQDAHERGMQVIPWTVNEKSAMKKLIQQGVDGLITDYPNRGLEVLRILDTG